MAEQYDWVDGLLKADQSRPFTQAVVKINRASPLFSQDFEKTTHIAVERFRIRTMLPLFDTTQYTFALGLRQKDTSHMATLEVSFGGGQFLYDYRHLAIALTRTLQTLCASRGLSEKPSWHFDPETGKFGVVSTEAFREDWMLFVSDDIRHCLNTFLFVEDEEDGGWWMLALTQDAEVQPIQTLELLSPVNRIIIDTTAPIVKSMLPEPGHAEDVSDRRGGYMVDFNYTQNNNQHLALIDFAVGSDAVHRWCNLLPRSQMSEWYFSFHWMDYSEVLRPMIIPPQGQADIKCVFKSV